MRNVQKNWFGTAAGLAMNPDKAHNLTCVDVVDHYAEAIFPGVPWTKSVGGVTGAKELLGSANREYWAAIENRPSDPDWLPLPGDVVVYGGTLGNPFGHTFVVESADRDGMWGIEQNGTGNSLVPAARVRRGYFDKGAGYVIGWLRPRPEKMPPDAQPGTKLLTVTADVVQIRTSPRVEPGNIAPEYPHGIAKGAKIAAVGYVAGQDPYPNDGVLDNAWIKTVRGRFAWANAVGNDISGLAKL